MASKKRRTWQELQEEKRWWEARMNKVKELKDDVHDDDDYGEDYVMDAEQDLCDIFKD